MLSFEEFKNVRVTWSLTFYALSVFLGVPFVFVWIMGALNRERIPSLLSWCVAGVLVVQVVTITLRIRAAQKKRDPIARLIKWFCAGYGLLIAAMVAGWLTYLAGGGHIGYGIAIAGSGAVLVLRAMVPARNQENA
jgi:hypothetical protein